MFSSDSINTWDQYSVHKGQGMMKQYNREKKNITPPSYNMKHEHNTRIMYNTSYQEVPNC